MLINVITPVGFGSSGFSSSGSGGTQVLSTVFACCCNDKLRVTYTFKPPPPKQFVSSEGQPKTAFFLSSFVLPNTANWGSFNNCLFTSATTCSASATKFLDSTTFKGASFADLAWISTINPSFSIIFMTSFLLSRTLSGYFLGL